MKRLLRFSSLVAAMALAGCAIPPRIAAPDLEGSAPLAGMPVSSAAQWPDREWWRRYADPQLDALQAQALRSAPNLAVAQARVQMALRNVDVSRADGGVSVDGNAQLQRNRMSENGLIPSQFLGFNWYSQGDLGAQLRYEFDFWGSHGAAIAAATSRAQAAAAEREGVRAMLAAGIAQTYFLWQADQARIAIAQQIIDGYERGRVIAAARARQGLSPRDQVLQVDAALAAAREQLAAVIGDARIQRAALAALLGVAPAQLPTLEARALPQARLELPADAELDLVSRRADIVASRWRVQAALRDTDVARAAFYPNLSLSAMAGLSSIDLGKLLDPGSAVFAAGPALHLPIFEGGRLRARFGVSQAALDAAVADYRARVVDAAQDVAAQALRVEQLRQRREQADAQATALRALLDTAQRRAARGLIDDVPVLDAGEKLDRQRDAQLQLAVAALGAEISLTHALGGGFQADPSPLPANPQEHTGAPSP